MKDIMSITIAYSPGYLKWTGSHASPMRAALAVEHLTAQAVHTKVAVEIIEPVVNLTVLRDELARVHDPAYVTRVLDGKESGHRSIEQGLTAALMFEGTRALVERIEADNFAPQVYFNPQGAKHHAAYAHSSGFCVFNDMAWAAQHFTDKGMKVAYLDWDVHHGDGVEALTADNPQVMTVSIHQWGIFPGTGHRSDLKRNIVNYPLDAGDSDGELFDAVQDALYVIEQFNPDILLLAAGADAHAADPLGQLRVTVEGFAAVAQQVGQVARSLSIPVLIGGAGGYTPFTYVPIVWAEVVRVIDAELSKEASPQVTEVTAHGAHAWEEGDEEEPSERDRKEALIASLRDSNPLEWENMLTQAEFELIEHDITPLIMQALEDKEQAELAEQVERVEGRFSKRRSKWKSKQARIVP